MELEERGNSELVNVEKENGNEKHMSEQSECDTFTENNSTCDSNSNTGDNVAGKADNIAPTSYCNDNNITAYNSDYNDDDNTAYNSECNDDAITEQRNVGGIGPRRWSDSDITESSLVSPLAQTKFAVKKVKELASDHVHFKKDLVRRKSSKKDVRTFNEAATPDQRQSLRPP